MTGDERIGRLGAGLAALALVGLGVHLLAAEPRPPRSVAAPAPAGAVPDAAGDVAILPVGERAVEAWPAITTAGISWPVIEPFTAEEALPAGESLETVLNSIGTQFTNSLGPMFMNYSIMLPVALAPRVLQQVTAALEAPGAGALPADAVAIDVEHPF